MLGIHHRLGIRQGGQRLVALRWQEQSFEGAAEAIALGPLPKKGIKLFAVGLEWTRGRGGDESWLNLLARSTPSPLISTNYRQ